MVQRRLKLLAASVCLVLTALTALGFSAPAQALSTAPISDQAKVADHAGKACIKFRAPTPSQKKCRHTTVTTSAARRSSSDDLQPAIVYQASAASYPRSADGEPLIADLPVRADRQSNQRRAPFWAVFALTKQLRN